MAASKGEPSWRNGADPGKETSEFSSFENLTRKLLKVPKAELDESQGREGRAVSSA